MKTEITRSKRRKNTVSARLEGDVLHIQAPEDIAEADLQDIVRKLGDRLVKRRTKRELNARQGLLRRAQELNQTYFKNTLKLGSVEYVTNQERRFGSCSTRLGAIRLSHRLAKMPPWVRDYVLIHEMAHLVHPNHGRRFWALVSRYPLAERARGYLMAVGMEAPSEGSGEESEQTPADEVEE